MKAPYWVVPTRRGGFKMLCTPCFIERTEGLAGTRDSVSFVAGSPVAPDVLLVWGATCQHCGSDPRAAK